MTWHNTTGEQQRFGTKTKNKKIFWSWELTYMCRFHSSGACPTNDTRTKPETRPKSDALQFNTYPTDHNEISHTPRQCNGRDLCKTAPRSAEHTSNQSTPNPDQNPNPISIPSVGKAPGQHWVSPATSPTVHGAQTTHVSTLRVQRPIIGGQWEIKYQRWNTHG